MKTARSASVPEETPMACGEPQYPASAASNASTFGPRMNFWVARTSSISARMGPAKAAYCSLRSSKGTRMARKGWQFRPGVQTEVWLPFTLVDLRGPVSYHGCHVAASRAVLARSFSIFHLLFCRALRVRHERFYERVQEGTREGAKVRQGSRAALEAKKIT